MKNELYPLSQHWERMFKEDPKSIFNEVYSQEQETYYSCGPAVLSNVLITLGKNISQQDIMDEVRREIRKIRPAGSKLSLSDVGTPPTVIENILSNHGVEYKKIEFDEASKETDMNATNDKKAEAFLDEKLEQGCVIITPVQTTPNRGEERNINKDGHYLIVCGVFKVGEIKKYITVDPAYHYYQRLCNEALINNFNRKSDEAGNASQSQIKKDLNSVDTSDFVFVRYTPEELVELKIDPSRYGLRIIDANNFIRHWKDVSGFGNFYNHYGVAIKVK